MAKRDTLRLSQYQSVGSYVDGCGRCFIAFSNNASVFIRDIKELRKFLKIPKSIPMRKTLDEWLDSLPECKSSPAVGDANVEGSFDPLAHSLDEGDPNFQTKTII